CRNSGQRREPPMADRIDNVIEAKGALILGAGLAGLFTALKLAPYPALILCGARPGTTGSSVWAQGGIAAAVAPGDTWQSHAADPIAYGAPFDRDSSGALAVAREAAHSAARVVHVSGDRAGLEITRAAAKAA